MSESMPPEGQQPLTQAQIRQLRRDLTEQVLERAESDPQWKQLLLDDPELAMREANFPEAQQLRQRGRQRTPPPEGEVVGQGGGGGYGHHGGYYGGYGPHCGMGQAIDGSEYYRTLSVPRPTRCVQRTLFSALR